MHMNYIQTYSNDKISYNQNATQKVRITFYVDDKDVYTKVICKIRNITNGRH